MEIEILSEEANPMLHRTDVRFEVVHNEATPGRLSVRDSLAARLNKDAEEVVIHKLDTKYGMRRTVGYAKVYDTPADAQDVEQEYMLARNKIGDAAVADETEPDTDDEGEPEDTATEEADAETDEEEPAEEAEAEADDEPDAAADEADAEDAEA